MFHLGAAAAVLAWFRRDEAEFAHGLFGRG
jgi:hypothetical protein